MAAGGGLVEVGLVAYRLQLGRHLAGMARVDAIVPSADPTSRTFQVKVLVDNPDGTLHSGMFARVGFQKGERPGLLVPETAVVRRGQLEGVFVVRDGRARLRWVRLGRAFGGNREVIFNGFRRLA